MAFRCPSTIVFAVTIDTVAPLHQHHPLQGATKRDYVFVVNPNGANGRTGKEWKNLLPTLNSKLGEQYNVREAFTSGPSHAVEIAREAIKDGAAAVVAVGGDGTLYEVINGFFEDGKPVKSKEDSGTSRTALGLIPLGTGSDFARHYGWKNDPYDAIERLANERRKPIDVGCLTAGESNVQRFFVNVASLHLSAKAGYFAAKYKKFGNLCYVIGALQAFKDHKNQDMKIWVDGGEWQVVSQVTAMAIGNAKFFGGGMKITPTADPCSGDLEVVTLQGFKWYDFLLKMHKLYKGTHLSVKNVSSQRVHTIEIVEANDNSRFSKNKIFVQADGEHVGFLPATFAILPGVIDILI